MSIKKVLDTSFELIYREHIDQLLTVTEKYLSQIKPNQKVPYSKLFDSYNSDIGQALVAYGDKLRSETARILRSKTDISSSDRQVIQQSFEKYLQAELYIIRFDMLIESIGNALSRYGVVFKPIDYSVDLPKSLAETHARNTCKKIQMKVLNDVDLLLLEKEKSATSVGIYGSLDDFYNKHQLLFWILAIALPLGLSVLFG
jgi:hypothetical protein